MADVERLLVVDDEGPILHALQRTFEAAGYEVTACLDPAQALTAMEQREFQVISADYMMPGMTGADFLARARAMQPATIRILITAAHDFSAAVDAINNGEIFRILSKPWNRLELLGTVRQAFDTYSLREKNRQLTELVRDVPLRVGPADIAVQQWDREEVHKVFDALQFRVLRERLYATLSTA